MTAICPSLAEIRKMDQEARVERVLLKSKADILEEWLFYVKDGLERRDPEVVGVSVAVLIVVVSLVLFLIVRSRSNSRRGILLMGICESGKTALFLRLTTGGYKVTYTSIKENMGVYRTTRNKSLKMIDIPGHERLRNKFLAQYASLARGVVFMVDSGTLQKEIRDVAEYLYILLTDPTISKNAPPFLIACNKQDQNLAKAASPIQAIIEKELNTLRVTKSAALQGTEDLGSSSYLGKQGKTFTFADLRPIKVQFVECHVTTDSDESLFDVKDVQQWLDKVG